MAKKRDIGELDVGWLRKQGVDKTLLEQARLPEQAKISHDLRMRFGIYRFTARIDSVYDGDSYRVTIDQGFGIERQSVACRAYGLNCPEVSRRGGKSEEHVRRGKLARDIVKNLVEGKDVIVTTHLDKRGRERSGVYGRLLVQTHVEDFRTGAYFNLNKFLVDEGLAEINFYGDKGFAGWDEL